MNFTVDIEYEEAVTPLTYPMVMQHSDTLYLLLMSSPSEGVILDAGITGLTIGHKHVVATAESDTHARLRPFTGTITFKCGE